MSPGSSCTCATAGWMGVPRARIGCFPDPHSEQAAAVLQFAGAPALALHLKKSVSAPPKLHKPRPPLPGCRKSAPMALSVLGSGSDPQHAACARGRASGCG